MTKALALSCVIGIFILAISNSCKHKAALPQEYGGFPDDVGKIMIERCATAGCHNAKSYDGAGGLLLDSWEHLFKGGDDGTVVIPYSPQYSILTTAINKNITTKLAVGEMPADGTALSTDEFNLIYNWIASGAPDKNGNIAFEDKDGNRQKIYISQSNGLIAVIDGASQLVMRYIAPPQSNGVNTAAHSLKISNNGLYGYIGFTSANYLQRINTTEDKIDGALNLYNKRASGAVYISPDDSTVLATYFDKAGELFNVNASKLTMNASYINMINPHGIASDEKMDTIYVTGQYGNIIYKFPKNGFSSSDVKIITVDNKPPHTDSAATSPDPHEIMMLPDYSKYLVTCERTNEVKIIDAHTNAILDVFNTGAGSKPQEIAISKKQHLAYISCLLTPQATTGSIVHNGSIFVLDYVTKQHWTITGKFNYPHGIAVDDRYDVLYIVSQNTTGPPDHHPSLDNTNKGYFNMFSSIAPYKPINKGRSYYISVQPYSADVRFKDDKK